MPVIIINSVIVVAFRSLLLFCFASLKINTSASQQPPWASPSCTLLLWHRVKKPFGVDTSPEGRDSVEYTKCYVTILQIHPDYSEQNRCRETVGHLLMVISHDGTWTCVTHTPFVLCIWVEANHAARHLWAAGFQDCRSHHWLCTDLHPHQYFNTFPALPASSLSSTSGTGSPITTWCCARWATRRWWCFTVHTHFQRGGSDPSLWLSCDKLAELKRVSSLSFGECSFSQADKVKLAVVLLTSADAQRIWSSAFHLAKLSQGAFFG